MSHLRVRGAILGLALFLTAFTPTKATELHQLVQRWLGQQSYILIEYESQPPRLLLLDDGTQGDEQPVTTRAIQEALVNLSHNDPGVREDALLSLADIESGPVADLIATALADSSADVRDTAASILEDLAAE